MNPDNACTLRITAAAGTELAGAYSYGTVSLLRKRGFVPYKRSLQPRGPSSSTRHGWVRVASIAQYSLLLPPVGVGPVSQCRVTGRALTPVTDRRLGGPLPRQLPNQAHAHP